VRAGHLFWEPSFMPGPITHIYIDGYNFYHGLLKIRRNEKSKQKKPKHKWLNYRALFKRMYPSHDIKIIHYFTSKVGGESGKRQRIFIRACETLPDFEIKYGNYARRGSYCRIDTTQCKGSITLFKFQEKGTDVNIAVQMIADAHDTQVEKLVLATADSDLVTPVEYIVRRFTGKHVEVAIPAIPEDKNRYRAYNLRNAATSHRDIKIKHIKKSLFPNELYDAAGKKITIPPEWNTL